MSIAVGVNLSPVAPEALSAAAVLAERLGFESGWIGEHIIVPARSDSASPYAGHPAVLPHLRFYEPFVALAHLAARTRSLRLGTGIALLPLRDPFLTGRAIATADVLSGGRLLIGVGAGWLAEEFEVMNVPFASRGQRMDEALQLLDRLLTERDPWHSGALWQLPASGFEPKPAQRPRPPILVGGASPAALRRCARLADGWYGSRHTPEEVAAVGATLADLRGEPMPLTVAAVDGAAPGEYADAGAERLIVTPWARPSEWRAGLEGAAERLGLSPAAALAAARDQPGGE